jgi:hypothetical protein
MKKIIAGSFALWLMVFTALGANLETETLSKLEALTVPSDATPGDIGNARIQSRQKIQEWALESIALLVTTEQQDDFLELLWWQTEHPTVRVMIVAGFKCRTVEDRVGIPSFEAYAARFAKSEEDQRLQEIKYVQEHITELTRLLKRLTSNLPRCAKLHEQYESTLKALETKK